MSNPLMDPITFLATIKGGKFDEHGEWNLTLRIPADQAVKAAQLSLMRGIVFEATFTPEDAVRPKETRM